MKIQYIAVIFIVIILPIILVSTFYINSEIKTLDLQSNYNDKLNNATYDAVKAFQINTVNNRFSSISDSKIRDIEASVNTFFNSLSNTELLTKEDLQNYVPALVYTLYDGYYIYSKYDNVIEYDGKENSKIVPATTEEEIKKTETNYGLKPYIYYSCRYVDKDKNKDFIVNYTLDNAITLYGKFGNEGYKTLSGFLINYSDVNNIRKNDNPRTWSLEYGSGSNKVIIKPELLKEHLLFADGTAGDYYYLVYNGQKIYYEGDINADINKKYFYYNNYSKMYVLSNVKEPEVIKYLKERTEGEKLYSTSAFEYFYNAHNFSKEVDTLTRGITQEYAVDERGNKIEFNIKTEGDIFVPSKDNNPLLEGSSFDDNRREVIRRSIETNLSAAIGNYSEYSGNNFQYRLPIISEEYWDNITNNMCLISFLQGIPIGHKVYNNYCVLANNNNKEVINKNTIYILARDRNTGSVEYHLPGCIDLMKDEKDKYQIIGEGALDAAAYQSTSFARKTVKASEGDYKYFYPQSRGDFGNIITSCYSCIVNAGEVYNIDQIIKGELIVKNENWEDEVVKYNKLPKNFKIIKEKYIHALARERYDLYQSNMNAFNN